MSFVCHPTIALAKLPGLWYFIFNSFENLLKGEMYRVMLIPLLKIKKKILVICPGRSTIYETIINRIKNALKVAKKLLGEDFSKIEFDFKNLGSRSSTICTNLAEVLCSGIYPVVISPLFSEDSLCLPPVVEKSKAVLINLLASDSVLTRGFERSFRIIHKNEDQGRGAAIFVKKFLKLFKGAVVLDNSAKYSSIISHAFRNSFLELGGKLTVIFKSEDIENFSLSIKLFLGGDSQFLFSASSAAVVLKIIDMIKETNFTGSIILSDWAPLTIDERFCKKLEGAYYITPYSTNEPLNEKDEEFKTAYKKEFSTLPGSIESLSFDAFMVSYEIIKERLNLNPSKLKEIRFVGVTGTFKFDENGDPVKPVIFEKVVNGKGKLLRSVEI